LELTLLLIQLSPHGAFEFTLLLVKLEAHAALKLLLLSRQLSMDLLVMPSFGVQVRPSLLLTLRLVSRPERHSYLPILHYERNDRLMAAAQQPR
jgi:hypothetical protein